MEINSIKSILEKNKKVIFSPAPEGLHYVSVDVPLLKVTFTTDTPDYKEEDLEGILEEFYAKFYITHFQIKIHIHKGKKHSKDIILNLIKNNELIKLSEVFKGIDINKISDLDRMAEVVHFIMDKFYEVDSWKYKTLN